MWRRERDVSTKTKYAFEMCNMWLAVFVRLKTSTDGFYAVLPSKFRTRRSHVLSPYTCSTYIPPKADLEMKMSATSVIGCLYKDLLRPYNSSTQLTFTNQYQHIRRSSPCGEGRETCVPKTEQVCRLH